jgi:hypothetical protein
MNNSQHLQPDPHVSYLSFNPLATGRRAISCLLLLGAILLISCGAISSLNNTTNNTTTPATPAVSTAPAPTIAPITLPSATNTPVNQSGLGDSVDLSAIKPDPQLGKITFALGATTDRQPLEPGMLFTYGITEVHAIFTHTHMSTAYTWERVWYINDQEISRSPAQWTGPADGVFDYFINNGGKPLPAGDWVLELYVEKKLRALGVFIIQE